MNTRPIAIQRGDRFTARDVGNRLAFCYEAERDACALGTGLVYIRARRVFNWGQPRVDGTIRYGVSKLVVVPADVNVWRI